MMFPPRWIHLLVLCGFLLMTLWLGYLLSLKVANSNASAAGFPRDHHFDSLASQQLLCVKPIQAAWDRSRSLVKRGEHKRWSRYFEALTEGKARSYREKMERRAEREASIAAETTTAVASKENEDNNNDNDSNNNGNNRGLLIKTADDLKARLERDSICLHSKAKIGICAMQRSSSPREVQEWLSHYLLLGVTHFILYDNSQSINESRSFRAAVKPFLDAGYVTLRNHFLPGDLTDEHFQSDQAFIKCFEEFRQQFDWMGSVDTDEFLVIDEAAETESCLESVMNQYQAAWPCWRTLSPEAIGSTSPSSSLSLADEGDDDDDDSGGEPYLTKFKRYQYVINHLDVSDHSHIRPFFNPQSIEHSFYSRYGIPKPPPQPTARPTVITSSNNKSKKKNNKNKEESSSEDDTEEQKTPITLSCESPLLMYHFFCRDWDQCLIDRLCNTAYQGGYAKVQMTERINGLIPSLLLRSGYVQVKPNQHEDILQKFLTIPPE